MTTYISMIINVLPKHLIKIYETYIWVTNCVSICCTTLLTEIK